MKGAMPPVETSQHDTDEVTAAVKRVAAIPAGPFQERRRHPVMLSLLSRMASGVPAAVDTAGNLVAWFAGASVEAPLIFSAHLDTVFPLDTVEITEDEEAVYGPGVADDASGLAALAWLAGKLRHLPGKRTKSVLFAFTVGEEGSGGLRGIRHLLDFLLGRNDDHSLERLLPAGARSRPAALIAIDGTLGSIVSRGLHIKRRKMTWRGPGGHSWGAAGSPSAISAAAAAIARIGRIRVRPGHTTVNTGVISGGTSVNTIAPECSAEIEVRSVSGKRAAAVMTRVERTARESASASGIAVRIETLDERPGGATRSSHPCVRLLVESMRRFSIKPSFAVSSTEANAAMAEGIPALATGVVQASGAHTEAEKFFKSSLPQGLQLLLSYAAALLG